jgi:hypothetical protein
MRRKLTPMNYISRSHPERDDVPDQEAQAEMQAAEVREAAPRVELPEPPEIEPCSHCGGIWHPVEPPCAAKVRDLQVAAAVELLERLRASGARVSLYDEGRVVRVSGYKPTDEEADAIRSAKPQLLVILQAEAHS